MKFSDFISITFSKSEVHGETWKLETKKRPTNKLSQMILNSQSFAKKFRYAEAVVQRCSVKMVFLEISQNSQENTCARVSFFKKVAGLRPATLLKKRLCHRCFPVNLAKFLRTPFSIEHLW